MNVPMTLHLDTETKLEEFFDFLTDRLTSPSYASFAVYYDI